jgi:hypothetical protein
MTPFGKAKARTLVGAAGRRLGIALLCTLVPLAQASEPRGAVSPDGTVRGAPPEQRQVPEVGDRTRQLLAQQRAGDQASPHDQWLSGDVQREIYRRYVRSFTREIPEVFLDPDFGN